MSSVRLCHLAKWVRYVIILKSISYAYEEYSMAGKGGENEPLDETDERILDIVDDLHKKDDPMPEGLNKRILDALKQPKEK